MSDKKSFFQKWKDYAFLHISILIYSVTIVLSKVASDFAFMSFGYIMCYGGMVAILGIYAILWQQVIKRFEPSVAYSHKSVTVIWALLISGFLFGENITLGNVIGTILIVAGVVMVSQDEYCIHTFSTAYRIYVGCFTGFAECKQRKTAQEFYIRIS